MSDRMFKFEDPKPDPDGSGQCTWSIGGEKRNFSEKFAYRGGEIGVGGFVEDQ